MFVVRRFRRSGVRECFFLGPRGPTHGRAILAAEDDRDFVVSCHALRVPEHLLTSPSCPLDPLLVPFLQSTEVSLYMLG